MVQREKKMKRTKHTWSSLEAHYGEDSVRIVRWFMESQQKRWPRLIKGELGPNHSRILDSVETLDKLSRIDGYDLVEEVEPVLKIAAKDEFWSRWTLTLGSLRGKYSKKSEMKFVNMQMSLCPPVPADLVEDPEDILEDHFTTGCRKWCDRCLNPLLAQSNCENGEGRDFASELCKLSSTIVTKQKRPDVSKLSSDVNSPDFEEYSLWTHMIPDDFRLVSAYVEWLETQDWLQPVRPSHLRFEGKVFQKFLFEKQKEIGFDILLGRSLH